MKSNIQKVIAFASGLLVAGLSACTIGGGRCDCPTTPDRSTIDRTDYVVSGGCLHPCDDNVETPAWLTGGQATVVGDQLSLSFPNDDGTTENVIFRIGRVSGE
ncbi:MAG: hypothetical protein HRU17_17920 [Polyangiaceae bacterium]|nr:hypothetical protein [Polyangiaceae bacterium]